MKFGEDSPVHYRIGEVIGRGANALVVKAAVLCGCPDENRELRRERQRVRCARAEAPREWEARAHVAIKLGSVDICAAWDAVVAEILAEMHAARSVRYVAVSPDAFVGRARTRGAHKHMHADVRAFPFARAEARRVLWMDDAVYATLTACIDSACFFKSMRSVWTKMAMRARDVAHDIRLNCVDMDTSVETALLHASPRALACLEEYAPLLSAVNIMKRARARARAEGCAEVEQRFDEHIVQLDEPRLLHEMGEVPACSSWDKCPRISLRAHSLIPISACVMEIFEGGSLDEWVFRGASLARTRSRARETKTTPVPELLASPALVQSMAAQLCIALGALHMRGVVHNDVHLGNIFLRLGAPGGLGDREFWAQFAGSAADTGTHATLVVDTVDGHPLDTMWGMRAACEITTRARASASPQLSVSIADWGSAREIADPPPGSAEAGVAGVTPFASEIETLPTCMLYTRPPEQMAPASSLLSAGGDTWSLGLVVAICALACGARARIPHLTPPEEIRARLAEVRTRDRVRLALYEQCMTGGGVAKSPETAAGSHARPATWWLRGARASGGLSLPTYVPFTTNSSRYIRKLGMPAAFVAEVRALARGDYEWVRCDGVAHVATVVWEYLCALGRPTPADMRDAGVRALFATPLWSCALHHYDDARALDLQSETGARCLKYVPHYPEGWLWTHPWFVYGMGGADGVALVRTMCAWSLQRRVCVLSALQAHPYFLETRRRGARMRALTCARADDVCVSEYALHVAPARSGAGHAYVRRFREETRALHEHAQAEASACANLLASRFGDTCFPIRRRRAFDADAGVPVCKRRRLVK